MRKYTDIAVNQSGINLFIVDRKQARYIDCNNFALPFGPQFIADIVNRTHVAQDQAQCLLATELVIKAQNNARCAFRSLGKRGRSAGYEEQGERRAVETANQAAILKGAAQAAAVAGFPTIVPASVFGQMAPSNRINVGAIGVGRISRVHDLPAILKSMPLAVTAVCDLVFRTASTARQAVRQRLLLDQRWQAVRWRN